MQTTSNYGLKKPDLTDVVDIQNFNDNADIIDSELSKRALKTDIKVTSVAGKTGAVTLSKSDVGLNNVNNWGASTAVNNTSTTTYATASAVKQAYDKAVEVFNSSTDGKKKLAQAITTKGVATSASDTFSTMANNINKIQNGVTIDGQQTNKTVNLQYHGVDWDLVSSLPYGFYQGCAVVYNNEIHILGGYATNKSHYKWNGSTWTQVSTLPYEFYSGGAVVYNNEIHMLGSGSYAYNCKHKHYKWNGSTWAEVSTIIYGLYNGNVVVYNNEIHLLGGEAYATRHCKWNGQSWTETSTLPYGFYGGGVVVYNNELHIMGCENSEFNLYHYKYNWNNRLWSYASTLPYELNNGCTIVYNNEIHIMGSDTPRYMNKHWKWNGVSWVEVSTLSNNFYYGCSVMYNNEIHRLGTKYNTDSSLGEIHTRSIARYYIE